MVNSKATSISGHPRRHSTSKLCFVCQATVVLNEFEHGGFFFDDVHFLASESSCILSHVFLSSSYAQETTLNNIAQNEVLYRGQSDTLLADWQFSDALSDLTSLNFRYLKNSFTRI